MAKKMTPKQIMTQIEGNERSHMFVSDDEKSRWINDFLRDMGTLNASNMNLVGDRAASSGASVGAQNALLSNVSYKNALAAEKGVSGIHNQANQMNREAARFIYNLQQQKKMADEAANAQMWGGIGSGLGMMAGGFLGGPGGATLGAKLFG